jgi:hypothetical protein
MSSVFDWKGQPSQILDNFGRIKSEFQIAKDAKRVNKYSDNARNFGEAASDKTARIMGKANSARSQ